MQIFSPERDDCESSSRVSAGFDVEERAASVGTPTHESGGRCVVRLEKDAVNVVVILVS